MSISKYVVEALDPKELGRLSKNAANGCRVIPIDATWYMPNVGLNGKDKYLNEERIKHSAFFDLDSICLPKSKYPHMLPTYDIFHKAIKELGIRDCDKLVVYDKSGIFSSPRVAWTLSLFGTNEVYLLNSYTKYKALGLPVENGRVEGLSTDLPLSSDQELTTLGGSEVTTRLKNEVIDYEELLQLVQNGTLADEYILFDARSHDRFTGKAPEPRPGLSSGHVPSALSLPFDKLLTSEKTYKNRDEMIDLFLTEFNIDFSSSVPTNGKKIIVMCGTGVTACIIKLALESIIGTKVPVRVYDGSWTEWGQRAPSEFIVKDV